MCILACVAFLSLHTLHITKPLDTTTHSTPLSTTFISDATAIQLLPPHRLQGAKVRDGWECNTLKRVWLPLLATVFLIQRLYFHERQHLHAWEDTRWWYCQWSITYVTIETTQNNFNFEPLKARTKYSYKKSEWAGKWNRWGPNCGA